MTIADAPVHLAAGDEIDAGALLIEDRRLGRPVLGVGDIGLRQAAVSEPASASYQRGTLCEPTTIVV